ncbi:mannose-6-phosphate isomerase [Clostridiaceae bacterium M8S5]|nr:mannose-6-phosphate isomerase [Clostridiaceae bacterium M8S5]
MYPLKFEHIYVKKVWGGRRFSFFRKDLPDGDIGESWELSCRKDVTSIVSNGKYKGENLKELILRESDKIIGSRISTDRFPVLIKLLDAKNKLSLQVHPNDSYALKEECDLGKNEVWVVLEATEDAYIVAGTQNCTPEIFKQALESGEIEQYLNHIKVRKGDVYFIKSGLIHSMEGALVAEIQQNSDVTYRVYDYNRDREVHKRKAMDVIDFDLQGRRAVGLKVQEEGYDKTYYCYNKHFSLEEYNVKRSFSEKSNPERFYIFMCIEGDGEIIFGDGLEKITKGDTVLIPASLGEYTVKGECKLLKSYVPDIPMLEKEILSITKY